MTVVKSRRHLRQHQTSTMATRTISPTGSYTMIVPESVSEDKDERVASYWIAGQEVLLLHRAMPVMKDNRCQLRIGLVPELKRETCLA